MNPEQMLVQMEKDVESFRRVTELIDANRSTLKELMASRNQHFAKDSRGADFLATVVYDLVSDLGRMLESAVEAAKAGDLDLSKTQTFEHPTGTRH